VLGVAELAAPGGEAAGTERVHSAGIGQPKPPEQLAPAVRPVGGKGFGPRSLNSGSGPGTGKAPRPPTGRPPRRANHSRYPAAQGCGSEPVTWRVPRPSTGRPPTQATQAR
jgi:hypothetical protein